MNYDLIVIGSGLGGQTAALQGAQAGLRVALIERERKVGGAAVLQGVLPSKMLREAALALLQMKRNAAAFDVSRRKDLELADLLSRLDPVRKSHATSLRQRLGDHRVELFHGRARLAGTHEVEVISLKGAVQTLRGEFIIVATGSSPSHPANIPVDHEHILDSDSILNMVYLPSALTVLGSGSVLAAEYASIFSLLGVNVTFVEAGSQPLPFLDPELRSRFVDHFMRFGGRFQGDGRAVSVRWDGVSQVVTTLDSGEILKGDKVLAALGRAANVAGLGLEDVGVQLNPQGLIATNDHGQTNVPHIYAVGDVVECHGLGSNAMVQGDRAVRHALGLGIQTPNHWVPTGIYTVPEIATVGLTESEARQQFGDSIVGRGRFEDTSRGQIAGITEGLLKLVADSDGRKLLGVQIIGEGAGDLIHLGAFAVRNGSEVRSFLDYDLNYPSYGEVYRTAALDLVSSLNQRKAHQETLRLEEMVPDTLAA